MYPPLSRQVAAEKCAVYKSRTVTCSVITYRAMTYAYIAAYEYSGNRTQTGDRRGPVAGFYINTFLSIILRLYKIYPKGRNNNE